MTHLIIGPSTTTADDTSRSFLLSVVRDDDDSWIVSEHGSAVYGHGETLLVALVDFWAALRSTEQVLSEGPIAAHLKRQRTVMRRLLGKEHV